MLVCREEVPLHSDRVDQRRRAGAAMRRPLEDMAASRMALGVGGHLGPRQCTARGVHNCLVLRLN